MKSTIWDGALYPDHEGSKAAEEDKNVVQQL